MNAQVANDDLYDAKFGINTVTNTATFPFDAQTMASLHGEADIELFHG